MNDYLYMNYIEENCYACFGSGSTFSHCGCVGCNGMMYRICMQCGGYGKIRKPVPQPYVWPTNEITYINPELWLGGNTTTSNGITFGSGRDVTIKPIKAKPETLPVGRAHI